MRKSYAAEGHKFLFRGLTSTLVRAFPTNAATFVVVDWCFRLQSFFKNNVPTLQTDPTVSATPLATNSESSSSFFPNYLSHVWNKSKNIADTMHFWLEGMIPSIGHESNCGKCARGFAAGFSMFHEAICDADTIDLSELATKACMKCAELKISREVDVRLAVMAS